MTSKPQDTATALPRKINLHGKYLAAIENFVSTVTLGRENGLLTWNSEFEELRNNIVTLHSKFINEQNAIGIVVNECVRFSSEHQDRTGLLSESSNADLKAALTGRLKNFLESLPKNYTLQINLPSFPRWGAATHEISEGVRLVIGDPPPNGKNSLAEMWGTSPNNTSYLEIDTNGYFEGAPDSVPPISCISQAKQCAFILTTHGICGSENISQAKATATVIDTDTKKQLLTALPDSLARRFGKLFPDEEKLQVSEKTGQTLFGFADRLATTNEEKSEAFQDKLRHLKNFFKARNEPDFQSIAAAIEWYEDSLFADNQTFAYIAACIGLEAILGSNDHYDSMSKRLSDRYAFLLGKSRSERENMIKRYGEVLNLRGRLVHSKAARLSDGDVDLLKTAQKMLLDIIWHELIAMYAAQNRRA